MSNSQEQSLDENAVFLPVNESSPEFLHCEKERQAVERLLNAGPEAFYSSIGTKRSACFLSSEEVNQISSWAQDYRVNPLHVPREANGEEGSSEVEAFSSTYIPAYSDTPAPDLELGWPEKSPWVPKASVSVHTSPPAEGEAPVREIIRRHLQKAKQVIAIVTDRLTDGAIIDDLHTAASRGVPVYIILNQRSIQENFTLNRLRHPNMQVRVLGGKNFCSRTGRMVVGEMKDKFLLVDLETVINGSYSLTWTDAHLHRQLITVLHGPVVDSFDREFRILFAASFPILDTWRVDVTHVDTVQQLKDFSNLRFQKHLPSEPEITSPPSPPAGSLLDWEAMGVIQRDGCLPNNPFNLHEEIVAKEMKQQNNMLFNKNAPIMDGFSNNGNLFVERTRLRENTSPVTNNLPERSKSFNYPRASPADLTTPERRKSKEYILEKALSRQLSIEKSPYVNDKTTAILEDTVTEPAYNKFTHSSTERIEHTRREPILEEGSNSKETSSKVESTPSSRKPLILRMPQSESFNSVSDLINRLQSQQDTSGRLKRGSNAVLSEESQFRRDLNAHNTETGRDERRVTLPRLKASGLETDVTPTQALMKKRNDDLKPLLYRLPRTFAPMERPRSSSFVDWRRSLAELEAQQE